MQCHGLFRLGLHVYGVGPVLPLPVLRELALQEVGVGEDLGDDDEELLRDALPLLKALELAEEHGILVHVEAALLGHADNLRGVLSLSL